jgi:glycogen(starch) synthase
MRGDCAEQSRRCLLLSYAYAPSTGGIETVSHLLAEGLIERGYEVRVVTMTRSGAVADADGRFQVIRAPSSRRLVQLLRWSSVVVQSNFSFRLAWPLVCRLVSRPWVVVHHTPITRPSGVRSLRDRLKLHALAKAHCYAVSSYLASSIGVSLGVLANPYDDGMFRVLAGERARHTLIFLGRLVPAKGVDVLLRALGLLQAQSLSPNLTIVGDGPEGPLLKRLMQALGLQEQVRFVGQRSGAELVRLLNDHQVLVVPSRAAPPEARPMVALEGIACGCLVIAANQGGLPETIGPCGITFESESPADLAVKIRLLLASPQTQAQMRSQQEGFLRQFSREAVLNQYEAAIQRASARH